MSSLPIRNSNLGPSASEPIAKKPAARESSPAEALGRVLLQRKLEEIVVLTRESTNADGVAVALRDGQQFTCRASLGYAPETGVVVEPGQGVCGRCIIDARVLLCQDLEGDIRSALAAPVIVGDEIEGLIAAFSFKPSAFQSADIDLLSRIAVDIGEQVQSQATIRLVPREDEWSFDPTPLEPISVNDPGMDPSTREQHLEVLKAVTAPKRTEPSPAEEQSIPTTEFNAPTLRFLGYEEVTEPEELPASEKLGEYLSKWDIAVIFAAVLIAMLTFSAWLRHHRATTPYTSDYKIEQDTVPPQKASSLPSSPVPETHKNAKIRH